MYLPKMHPSKIRTLLGLTKLHIVLISSLNPGGVHVGGGGIVAPKIYRKDRSKCAQLYFTTKGLSPSSQGDRAESPKSGASMLVYATLNP